jgi:hypothetical protein
VIRVSDEAKRLLGTLWAPDGEVLRLTRSPEANGPEALAFRNGRGGGADQIFQHGGRQVLRIDRSVRMGGFAGSSVEVVDGSLGVVPPGPLPANDGETSKTVALAWELGVTALPGREETAGRGDERETPEEQIAENLSLEAQG